MFTHPHLASQLGRERHRYMLAQASQQHRARQLRQHARASRPEEPAGRRMTRAFKRIRLAALGS